MQQNQIEFIFSYSFEKRWKSKSEVHGTSSPTKELVYLFWKNWSDRSHNSNFASVHPEKCSAFAERIILVVKKKKNKIKMSVGEGEINQILEIWKLFHFFSWYLSGRIFWFKRKAKCKIFFFSLWMFLLAEILANKNGGSSSTAFSHFFFFCFLH